MYTSQKNLQILISLLKQYKIKHLVLSPGTRNSALCHSVEEDSDFQCYSMVDERSAAFFALGLSESLGEPVAFSCTSSTATCNYMPAIIEAYNKNIPLLALTGDREFHKLYQMEDLMIDQNNMYAPYTHYYCNLPIAKTSDMEWYCIRKVNEALHTLKKGPVQINFQVNEIKFPLKVLPKARKISIHETSIDWNEIKRRLSEKKRIMIICGQRYPYSENLSFLLKDFTSKYDAIVSADYFSNINSDCYIRTVLITEAIYTNPKEFSKYRPDLIITIGGHFWSFIKYGLRNSSEKIEHWRISEDGKIVDGFRALTDVFKCSEIDFFTNVNNTNLSSKDCYLNFWQENIKNVKYPDFDFSNFSVIRYVVSKVPENSTIHTSIFNATRLFSYSDVPSKVTAYSNLGADGIDGCLSSFLGESFNLGGFNFLITGDLSLIYDMNALINNLNSSHRILAINNYAGSEFHILFSRLKVPTLDLHIAAGHNTKLRDVVSITKGVKYLSASNQDELENVIGQFLSVSDEAIVLEVFTNADTDAYMLKLFYSLNMVLKDKVVNYIKQRIKNILIKKYN